MPVSAWRSATRTSPEIEAVGDVETTFLAPEKTLAQTDRIGERQDDDLAAHTALRLEPFQLREQTMGGKHPGHLVGMQPGLDVDARARAGHAVAQDRQLRRQPGRRAGQAYRLPLHVGLLAVGPVSRGARWRR
jgi:hypothetical protein